METSKSHYGGDSEKDTTAPKFIHGLLNRFTASTIKSAEILKCNPSTSSKIDEKQRNFTTQQPVCEIIYFILLKTKCN